METITLVKDHKRRQFSPRTAKIAIEHYGWSEITIPAKPSEVGTKTKPPIIDKPVKLKEIPIEKKIKVNDDLATITGSEFLGEIQNTEAKLESLPDEEKISEPIKEKKTRKPSVKSKSKK